MKDCHKTVTKELGVLNNKKKTTTSMTSTCSKENKTDYKKYSSTYLSTCYPCIYQPWKKAKTMRKKLYNEMYLYLDLNQKPFVL